MRNKVSVFLKSMLITATAAAGVWWSPAGQAAALPTERMDAAVKRNMEAGHIPGMAVVVVQANQPVYIKGFGYADGELKQPVTDRTLFEIGSTSKAFTALALLTLEKQGRVKLSEPVTTYLPWLKLTYEGQEQAVTLEQFMHHTSGIPFRTIGFLPEGAGEQALEDTVRGLVGVQLDHKPGSAYNYATVNYDVLGLVVQQLSGQPFETYVQSQVIKPLGLEHTYVGRQASYANPFAQGFKPAWGAARPYDAPTYRGNTPAGYIITNAADTARWLKTQLASEPSSAFDPALLAATHKPDRTVSLSSDGTYYAAGWTVNEKTGLVSHSGANPNYSSFFAFRPADGTAVGVLANLDSAYTEAAAQDILRTLAGEADTGPVQAADQYLTFDQLSTTAVAVIAPLAVAALGWAAFTAAAVKRGKRRSVRLRGWRAVLAVIAAALLAGWGGLLYALPGLLLRGLPWSFIAVWAPATLIYAVALLFVLALSLFVLLIARLATQKNKGLTSRPPAV